MTLYLMLLLTACVACAMLGVAVLARDRSRRESLLAAGVAGCGVWWAGCQLLWTAARDPDTAIRLIRASSLGWMTIGPTLLHLFLELSSHPVRRRRWLIPSLYGPGLAMALLDNTTPWLHPAAHPTAWGWSYSVEPLFLVPYAYSAGTVSLGMWIGWRRFRGSGPPADRRLVGWMFAGLSVPLVAASVTDGLGPLLGWSLPNLGTASITLLVLSIAWTFRRYGYSLIAPGAYAPEILATLREGVALLRPDGGVHSVNAGMARLLGVPARSLEGRDFRDCVDVELPPPDTPEQECALLPPYGDPVPVSVCTSLLRDKLHNPIGLVLVARDLREVASLRSRLITSGRLASVGQLAAGIAHEINNPVAYVRANLGSLQTLLEELPKSPDPDADLAEGRELIAESLDGVDRVAAIVRDVKGFSHAGASGEELIEVHRMLEAVLRVAAPQLRYRTTIRREFEEVPPLRGSSQQLKQVFLNLVINASQATGENGAEGAGDDEAVRPIRLVTRPSPDGCRVVVEVIDHGCGIPPDQIDRIFDPFFTTKPVGEGTGLGLSISYEIVRAHGGELSVRSRPGEGTCFRVELPVSDAETDADDAEGRGRG